MNDPQLRMVHRLAELPPARELPPGFAIRTATKSDAAGIALVLAKAFQEEWVEQGVRSVLLDHPDVQRTFIVEADGHVVATASYQVFPQEFPDSGWVHFVGADPAFVGFGLGYIVTRAVLVESADRGKADVRLTTDDWRLRAIRTYLKLGFEPEPWHETHEERWRAVLEQLRT